MTFQGKNRGLAGRLHLLEAMTSSPLTGNQELLRSVLTEFNKSQAMTKMLRIQNDAVDGCLKTVPLKEKPIKKISGRSTYSLDPAGRKKKPGVLTLTSAFSPVRTVGSSRVELSKSKVDRWNSIENALQQIGSSHCVATRIGASSSFGVGPLVGRQKDQSKARQVAPVLLLSPTTTRSQPAQPKEGRESLFSPSSVIKTRDGWDIPSRIDQRRAKEMTINAPEELREVTVASEARRTLAGFGTTPEKIQESLDVKRSGLASRSPMGTPSRMPPRKTGESSKKKSSTMASFPPMPSKAPTPFSQQSSKVKSKVSSNSSYPPMSSVAPKPFTDKTTKDSSDEKTKDGKTNDVAIVSEPATTSQPKKSESVGFGNMGGLGKSLFNLDKDSTKGAPSSFSPNAPANSTVEPVSSRNYKEMLTSFYQKHNQAKIIEVDKTLEKYKVYPNHSTDGTSDLSHFSFCFSLTSGTGRRTLQETFHEV